MIVQWLYIKLRRSRGPDGNIQSESGTQSEHFVLSDMPQSDFIGLWFYDFYIHIIHLIYSI